jgi:hypothetical protein
MNECVNRMVYRISSRNLGVGVYRAESIGFIGIREKFGDHYLFEEYHWEGGPPYGTVRPLEPIGLLPDGIELQLRLPSEDMRTGRIVEFDRTPVGEEPYPAKGWYFVDTHEYSRDIRPMSCMYRPLFDYLVGIEKSLGIYQEPMKYDEEV